MADLRRIGILRGGAACLIVIFLAAGLFITVRTLDTPSTVEMTKIRAVVDRFFASYDMVWPPDNSADETLPAEVRTAMRSSEQRLLRDTVTGEFLSSEMANDRVLALEELRETEGMVVTDAGHELDGFEYVRTALDRTVVVRTDVVSWRQEDIWNATASVLVTGTRTENIETYEVSLRRSADGWRIVGLRPVTEQ